MTENSEPGLITCSAMFIHLFRTLWASDACLLVKHILVYYGTLKGFMAQANTLHIRLLFTVPMFIDSTY